jgi:hypothetical protein
LQHFCDEADARINADIAGPGVGFVLRGHTTTC